MGLLQELHPLPHPHLLKDLPMLLHPNKEQCPQTGLLPRGHHNLPILHHIHQLLWHPQELRPRLHHLIILLACLEVLMGHLHMDHQVVLHMGHRVAHLMGYQEVLLMGHQVVLPMGHQVVIQLVHLQVGLQVVLQPDHKVGLQVVHLELQQDLVFLRDMEVHPDLHIVDPLITIKGVTLLRVILLDPIRDMAIISTQDTQTHLHLMLRVLLVVLLPKVILKDIHHLIKVIPLHMGNMVLHHLAVIIRHHRHSIIKDTLQPVSPGTDSTAHQVPRVKWVHHIQLAIRAMIKLEVDILVTLVAHLDLHHRKGQVHRQQRPLVPLLLPQYPHRQQLNKFLNAT